MLRVGVVGSGFWAREMHLPAFEQIDGARVVAVAASSAASARRCAERFGLARWTDDYRDLVADPEVDVVDVVAPNHLHAPITIAAAEAGKHIICIKPLARTVAEAETMLDAADRNGVRIFYAENVPFIPALRRAKEIVEGGAIGDIFRVKACEGIDRPHADWFFDPVRSGGGAMIDMAVHSIAFCRFFADAEVDGVYAETGTFVHGGHTSAEDTSVLTLRFANGVIGQCEDSWSLTGAMDSRFEVFGTGGRIMIDNLHRQPVQVMSAAGYSFPLPIPGEIADGHVAMLAHFTECICDGKAAISDGELGREILTVIEAAQRSVESGSRQPVQISQEVR